MHLSILYQLVDLHRTTVLRMFQPLIVEMIFLRHTFQFLWLLIYNPISAVGGIECQAAWVF